MEMMWFIGSIVTLLVGYLIPTFLGLVKCFDYFSKQPTEDYVPNFSVVASHRILDAHLTKTKKQGIEKWEYAEALNLGVAPVMGIVLIYILEDMVSVLNISYALSPIVFIIIAYLSYWLSRRFRDLLPLYVNLLLPFGMLIGIICYAVLFIHYLSLTTILAVSFASILTFPLLAPLPAMIYTFRQLAIQIKYSRQLLDSKIGSLPNWVKMLRWGVPIKNTITLITFISLIQLILTMLGQPVNGFWLAFKESSDFFFSTQQNLMDF